MSPVPRVKSDGESLLISHKCSLLLIFVALAASEDIDTRGTQFIFAFMENRILAEYPVPRILVTSCARGLNEVTISVPLWQEIVEIKVTLDYGETYVHQFTSDIHLTGTAVEDKGVLVESTGEVVVQAASINDHSSDAFLAFPAHALGQEYYVMSYVYQNESVYVQGPSQFAVVAANDETRVTITLRADDIQFDKQAPGIDKVVGRTIHVRLKWCETFQLSSFQDLTGTRIWSDKPLAALSGAVWTSVGAEEMGDHLVEQLPPTNTWGGEFYTVPVAQRTGGDIFRILAKERNTRVYIFPFNPMSEVDGAVALGPGEFYDLDVDSDARLHVVSNKQVLMAQFCLSNSADGNTKSDPFMALLPPVSQYSGEYQFAVFMSLFYNDYETFVSVVAPTGDRQTLQLNGKALEEVDHAGEVDDVGVVFETPWTRISTSAYSAAVLRLGNGTHVLNSTKADVTFAALLYGHQLQESYGLLLGQRLTPVDYFCVSLEMTEWAEFFDNDCDGLIDEEIANGLDDDGDGLIDEDVYNDRSARPAADSEEPTTTSGRAEATTFAAAAATTTTPTSDRPTKPPPTSSITTTSAVGLQVTTEASIQTPPPSGVISDEPNTDVPGAMSTRAEHQTSIEDAFGAAAITISELPGEEQLGTTESLASDGQTSLRDVTSEAAATVHAAIVTESTIPRASETETEMAGDLGPVTTERYPDSGVSDPRGSTPQQSTPIEEALYDLAAHTTSSGRSVTSNVRSTEGPLRTPAHSLSLRSTGSKEDNVHQTTPASTGTTSPIEISSEDLAVGHSSNSDGIRPTTPTLQATTNPANRDTTTEPLETRPENHTVWSTIDDYPNNTTASISAETDANNGNASVATETYPETIDTARTTAEVLQTKEPNFFLDNMIIFVVAIGILGGVPFLCLVRLCCNSCAPFRGGKKNASKRATIHQQMHTMDGHAKAKIKAKTCAVLDLRQEAQKCEAGLTLMDRKGAFLKKKPCAKNQKPRAFTKWSPCDQAKVAPETCNENQPGATGKGKGAFKDAAKRHHKK